MTEDGFSRRARIVGDVYVVSLLGELDMYTADGLSDWLVETAASPVVVDLSELTFMDSSGIAALAIARNRMEANGGELMLARPQPSVQRVLELVGMVDWLTDWDPKWECHLTLRVWSDPGRDLRASRGREARGRQISGRLAAREHRRRLAVNSTRRRSPASRTDLRQLHPHRPALP
jgi:anti-sigma B factor antagonist